MKRFAVIALFLAACLCMNGFLVAPAKTTVNAEGALDTELVFEAKLQNLININNVYGTDFTDNEKLTNRAAAALSGYADDYGFIPEQTVVSFVKDLYDIDLVITDDINADMPKKDGFVYLIPKGYTSLQHEILTIEDMSSYYRVTSRVTLSSHDGETVTATAVTLIVENNTSVFGYNILNADILYDTVSYTI